jgi:hypothetical protein
MVKAWAPETRQLVYDQMTYIWVHLSTQKWLKQGHQAGTKVCWQLWAKEHETYQYVWSCAKGMDHNLSKKNHLVWHNHEVLYSDQYGFRLDNGTPMALLNVVNEIKGAIYNKETKTSRYGTSGEPLSQF